MTARGAHGLHQP